MNTYKLCLLFAACAVASALTPVLAQGAYEVPTRRMHEASSSTGSLLKKELRWRSKIPLDKTWEQLTPEQQAEFRSLYESMPEYDEPPFPAEGIKPVFNAVKKAQEARQAKGELNFAVTVGPDGTATNVEDFGSVHDKEMTQYVSSVLLMTKYKPAKCNGAPCVMQFPFKLRLR